MKRLAIALVILCCAGQLAVSQTGSSTKRRSVTGHYSLKSKVKRNTLSVQQLPGKKIRFHVLALWISPNYPDNIHNGEIGGTVDLVNSRAVFFEDGRCKLTIFFTATGASVVQDHEVGDCDFGANVTATGNYRKINSRRPDFDEND